MCSCTNWRNSNSFLKPILCNSYNSGNHFQSAIIFFKIIILKLFMSQNTSVSQIYWHFETTPMVQLFAQNMCHSTAYWPILIHYHVQTVASQTILLVLQICNHCNLLGNNAVVCQILQTFARVDELDGGGGGGSDDYCWAKRFTWAAIKSVRDNNETLQIRRQQQMSFIWVRA